MDILQIILTASVTSGVITVALTWFLKKYERNEQRMWELKREACLDALNIIDSRFSDYQWVDNEGNPARTDKQEAVSTGEIRSCFNRLILSCNDASVPLNFEKCLNLKLGFHTTDSLNMNVVVDLRNAIRKELGFGKELTTTVTWVKYINWSNEAEPEKHNDKI